MNAIHAVILAAGPGKRLVPHTRSIPKALILVGKHPILHYQLFSLQDNNILQVAIVLGFMAEAIKAYALTHFPKIHFDFVVNPDFSTTNTLYSLALAAKKIQQNKTVLLLNGDVLYEPTLIAKILATEDEKSYTAVQFKPCGKEEIKILLNKNGSISLLNKKISSQKAVGESIGINKFTPAFWVALKKNLHSLKNNFTYEYFEFAVEKTISQGKELFPLDITDSKAIEIDFLSDLKEARKQYPKILDKYMQS